MTTFKELKRQVRLRLLNVDGISDLAIEEGINQAQKVIARVQDFDELMTLDTTHAATVAEQKTYHITSDWGLVRPKDIYTIRYMDEANSRKLIWVPLRSYDTIIPYPEQIGYSRPRWYIRRGMYVDLHPIPDEAKSLYITHSQWPDVLEADDDETPFVNLDDIIVNLGGEMAMSILSQGGITDWTKRAQALLGQALLEETERPDEARVARPFDPCGTRLTGEYWNNPWVREVD